MARRRSNPLKLTGIVAVLVCVVSIIYLGIVHFAPPHPDVLAGLIGAAATVLAGWLAWESLINQAQVAETKKEQEKARLAESRKDDLKFAITQAVHAAAGLAARIVIELGQIGDPDGQSLRVKRKAEQLSKVLNVQVLFPLMDELTPEDRNALLMVIGQMQVVLARAEVGSEFVLTDDDLSDMKGILEGLHRFIVLFDVELANGFAKGSRLGLPVGATTVEIVAAYEVHASGL